MMQEYFLIEDLKRAEKKAMRDGYGEELVRVAEKNKAIVALYADLKESMRLSDFSRLFPSRSIQVGIAEQNMMGVAAGMSLVGKIPFVNSFAVFSPGRNWDQLRVSVCYSKANVKVVGGHVGFSSGPDGATHEALEDIAITRVLPNLMVVAPADYEQMKKAVSAIAEYQGPVYMRMVRDESPVFTTSITPFKLGEAQLLRSGEDVSVIASGTLVYEALIAAEDLKDKISVEVINIHTIKPIDREAVIKSAKKTKRVVTVEEHQVIGGLGGAVAEVLSESCPTIMKRVGVRDRFGESGSPDELRKKYQVDRGTIVEAIKVIKEGR